jgi:hypothetical protein
MSNEQLNQGHGADFEREDLSTRGVFAFMIGLAVVGFVIYFILVGMYKKLDDIQRSQMATASPLVTSKSTMSRVVTQNDMDKAFKDNGAPMLEVTEGVDLQKDLVNQENRLNSYGWVDENAGVAHIPIEHAMDLIVQRGLPVLPADGPPGSATPASKTSGKKAATAKQ